MIYQTDISSIPTMLHVHNQLIYFLVLYSSSLLLPCINIKHYFQYHILLILIAVFPFLCAIGSIGVNSPRDFLFFPVDSIMSNTFLCITEYSLCPGSISKLCSLYIPETCFLILFILHSLSMFIYVCYF